MSATLGAARPNPGQRTAPSVDEEFALALADPRALKAEDLNARLVGALAATAAAVRRGESDPLRYADAQLGALGVPPVGDAEDLDRVAAGVRLYSTGAPR